MSKKYILWFEEITNSDVPIVGGKNASIGEMYQKLVPTGVRVPNGFAITIDGYKDSLTKSDILQLQELLQLLDKSKETFVHDLAYAGSKAREIIYKAELPIECIEQIKLAYQHLCVQSKSTSVAVRSSATAEDLPTASFAGQHDSYLNIENETDLIDAIKRCNASLFTDRAISYRMDKGFDHFKVFLSVCIMKMVRSDLACSGVMFTIDTETGFQGSLFITGSWGLGENIVQGLVDPDEYYVYKPTYKEGYKTVLRRRLGSKQLKMILSLGHTKQSVRNVNTPIEERNKYCLTDKQVLELADFGIKIEDHYSMLASNNIVPMDIEWALDGLDGLLYIVQARPETISGNMSKVTIIEQFKMDDIALANECIINNKGRAIGTKISSGIVHVVRNQYDLEHFKDNEVLVADSTSPDWEPVMKRAAGIITNRGGRTCHAAIVARELNIPAIVGTENITSQLETGDYVTICCALGEQGVIYKGQHSYSIEQIDLKNINKTKTKLMINMGNPEKAFAYSFLPCDGVGLCRMEFVITQYLKVHPMALIHPHNVKNILEQNKINELISIYNNNGSEYMIRTISEGVGTVAAAFYPRPVVIRLSDFKSNEYASLIGGKDFEPNEENPMLGLRGASRYSHSCYKEGFELECKALRRIVYELGLKNLIIMIPFCRTINEAKRVLNIMNKYDLYKGREKIQIYMMCEIPSNVILINEFSKLFDGFSIGSNDLTSLTLGCDRDNELITNTFDERDPAVMKILEMAIIGAKKNHKYISICGQAPSDFPEVVEMLIKLGIDSISVTADSFMKTLVNVNKVESDLKSQVMMT